MKSSTGNAAPFELAVSRPVSWPLAPAELPLEIDGSVRADCALAPNSPRRKGAAIGSCNPRSRRLDFALTPVAALQIGLNRHGTGLGTALTLRRKK